MPCLALYLLGPPRVELDGEPVHIGRKKALALLAYLAVTPDSRSADAAAALHPRETLATLLWPGYDQRSARAHLRRALASLTNRLGSEWFATDRETIDLSPTPELWLDVDQFRQRLAACEAHAHAERDACPDCLALLTEATELYRGDFMTGFTLPDSQPFDDWQRQQTAGLRDELGSALERLSDRHAAQGHYEPAIGAARRWLELDPLREAAHRRLMELYAQAGRSSEALRQYRLCVRALEAELGVPPSAETTALYERLRAERLRPPEQETTLASTSPEPTSRLPSVLDPNAQPAAIPGEVFVAREQQLRVLSAHLEAALDGQARVVFITGGPGRGKTALMNQFARRALVAHSDLLVARGTCNAYSGTGDPYLPFRELMSALTGDVEAAWASGAISQDHARRLWAATPLAAQALLHHGPYLINTLLSGAALLARATAAAENGPAWLRELSVWAERERVGQADLPQSAIFEQFTNVIRALAERHPLLLTMDDLQWADSGSISLLFHLGRRLADGGGRVLILGAYRPEEVSAGRNGERHPLEPVLDELQRRFGDVCVDLAQADKIEGRRFVDAYLDVEPNRLGEGFRSALFQNTGGHPLFTVELLQAMQARGDLIQDASAGGRWVEGRALDWEALPARVEAVIKARVGRLDEKLYDTLSVASVEGERFTAQIIAQVLEIPER
jgi:DNA-binding SARP family transcriptional activator